MVYFTEIKPTYHYIKEHEKEVPWNKVTEIILTTKNPRKKGDKFEIEKNGYYILFKIINNILYVINAKKVNKMKCPKCSLNLRKVNVKVQGAENKVISYQCPNCDYFEFEPVSAKKVVQELRETPLKMKQKVVKLSQERLGIYFNRHIVQSLNLKKGEEISVSVPDRKHIVLELG